MVHDGNILTLADWQEVV